MGLKFLPICWCGTLYTSVTGRDSVQPIQLLFLLFVSICDVSLIYEQKNVEALGTAALPWSRFQSSLDLVLDRYVSWAALRRTYASTIQCPPTKLISGNIGVVFMYESAQDRTGPTVFRRCLLLHANQPRVLY